MTNMYIQQFVRTLALIKDNKSTLLQIYTVIMNHFLNKLLLFCKYYKFKFSLFNMFYIFLILTPSQIGIFFITN